jgi:hypothetical protein
VDSFAALDAEFRDLQENGITVRGQHVRLEFIGGGDMKVSCFHRLCELCKAVHSHKQRLEKQLLLDVHAESQAAHELGFSVVQQRAR